MEFMEQLFVGTRTDTVVLESSSGEVKSLKRKKSYICKICEASFSQSGNLERHMRTHTGEKPYRCTSCESSFSGSNDLKRHMRIHTGEKPYQCSLCESSFTQPGNLERHVRIHTGDKPHKCSLCETLFSDPSHLKSHLSTHTGEKPYQCTSCEASFSRSGNLKRHMRTHTGEKPYRCTFCVASFSQSRDLNRHLQTHEDKKLHTCTVCMLPFANSSNLKKHVRTHRSVKPQKCTCETSFCRLCLPKDYMSTHVTMNEKSNASDEECSNEDSGSFDIPSGSSDSHKLKTVGVLVKSINLMRHTVPLDIVPCAPGEVKEVTESLVNLTGCPNDPELSQVKKEFKEEKDGSDEQQI